MYVCPSTGQKYESHAVIDDDELVGAPIVRFKVYVESHPFTPMKVALYVPEFAYVAPLTDQVKEPQAPIDAVFENPLFTTKFKVNELSHPTEFGIVVVYVPELVYVCPLAGHT